MKFGIVAAKDIKKAQDLSKKIVRYLKDHNHEVLEKNLRGADVVLTLGGDGTLIHAACEHAKYNVPFIGINAGTLGFLTAAEVGEWKEVLEKILKGDYFVSERMTIEVQIGDRVKSPEFRALNEIVVKGMYRVVDLAILVNDQKFLNITGDGVLVSTPTGSTAYSLSSGGPIVDPEVDCLLVTPINAVGLPIPSVVLSADDVIEINVIEGDDVSLVVDGQEHTKIVAGQSVKVVKGKYRVKFGYFDRHHFLKALNAKFGLGTRVGN